MLHYSPVPNEHLIRKPRKVFKKAKKHLPKELLNYTGRNSKAFSESFSIKNKEAKIFLKVSLACTTVILVSLILIFTYYLDKNKSFRHSAEEAKIDKLKQDLMTKQMDEAYHVLIKSGQLHMNYGDRNYANAEFQRALKINPYGKEAAFGLTEILADKCINLNTECELAQHWLLFCKKSFGDSNEIDDLENKLVQKSTYCRSEK